MQLVLRGSEQLGRNDCMAALTNYGSPQVHFFLLGCEAGCANSFSSAEARNDIDNEIICLG
jgi:hypothetical protein